MIYNKPILNLIIAFNLKILTGMLGPAFGVLIIKNLFAMITYMFDP